MFEFKTRLCTVALLGCSACSFTASASDGRPASDALLDANKDAADVSWTDTSVSDFSRPGATAIDATATRWNTLEPNGVVPGYWLAHAAPGTVPGFTGDETQIDWDLLPRNIPTSILNLSVVPFGNSTPPWLNATSDEFVFWGEGEILLAPGITEFELIVDDFAAVQIQAPNQSTFATVVRARFGNGPEVGSVFNPHSTATWVPLRFAMRDASGGATFEVRSRLDSTGAFTAIANSNMRANTTQESNLLAFGFDDFGNTQLSGARTWQEPLVDQATSTNVPLGLGLRDDSNYSVIWLGQYRAEQAGDYTFAFDTDDGHRLTIDGVIVVDQLGNAPATSQTTVALTAGWHDIEIDWWQAVGPSRALVTVQQPGMDTPAVFSPTQLRPVVTGRNRLTTVSRDGSSTVADNATTTFRLAVGLPADATIVDADLRVEFDGDDGTARLLSPGGTQLAAFDLTDDDTTFHHVHSDATLAAAGDWKLEINNDEDRPRTVSNVYLTVTYRSLASPAIATNSSFRSGPKIFEQPVAVRSMAWQRQGSGAIAGYIRGCTAVCKFYAPWVTVTNGASITGVTGTQIEYRFDFASDGIHVPAIDSVTVTAERQ